MKTRQTERTEPMKRKLLATLLLLPATCTVQDAPPIADKAALREMSMTVQLWWVSGHPAYPDIESVDAAAEG